MRWPFSHGMQMHVIASALMTVLHRRTHFIISKAGGRRHEGILRFVALHGQAIL